MSKLAGIQYSTEQIKAWKSIHGLENLTHNQAASIMNKLKISFEGDTLEIKEQHEQLLGGR